MVRVDVEYCSTCGHAVKYHELKETICRRISEAKVSGFPGRQGSFEVDVDGYQVYSKLQTLAFPDFDEIADIVEEVSFGSSPRRAIKQQIITCSVM